jgi:colicin import membrane protein
MKAAGSGEYVSAAAATDALLLPFVRFSVNRGKLYEDNTAFLCCFAALILSIVWSLAATALLEQPSFGLMCFATLILWATMLFVHCATDPGTKLAKSWKVLSESSGNNVSLQAALSAKKTAKDSQRCNGALELPPALFRVVRSARTSAIKATCEDDEADLFTIGMGDDSSNGNNSVGDDDNFAEERWTKEISVSEADLMLSISLVKALIHKTVVHTAKRFTIVCTTKKGAVQEPTEAEKHMLRTAEAIEGFGAPGDGDPLATLPNFASAYPVNPADPESGAAAELSVRVTAGEFSALAEALVADLAKGRAMANYPATAAALRDAAVAVRREGPCWVGAATAATGVAKVQRLDAGTLSTDAASLSAWEVLQCLQAQQARKFRTAALTLAHFQLEITRAAALAEAKRDAEFASFVAWARQALPRTELGHLAGPLLATAPPLELADVAAWGVEFKVQLSGLALRYESYLAAQKVKAEEARQDSEEQARRRKDIEEQKKLEKMNDDEAAALAKKLQDEHDADERQQAQQRQEDDERARQTAAAVAEKLAAERRRYQEAAAARAAALDAQHERECAAEREKEDAVRAAEVAARAAVDANAEHLKSQQREADAAALARTQALEVQHQREAEEDRQKHATEAERAAGEAKRAAEATAQREEDARRAAAARAAQAAAADAAARAAEDALRRASERAAAQAAADALRQAQLQELAAAEARRAEDQARNDAAAAEALRKADADADARNGQAEAEKAKRDARRQQQLAKLEDARQRREGKKNAPAAEPTAPAPPPATPQEPIPPGELPRPHPISSDEDEPPLNPTPAPAAPKADPIADAAAKKRDARRQQQLAKLEEARQRREGGKKAVAPAPTASGKSDAAEDDGDEDDGGALFETDASLPASLQGRCARWASASQELGITQLSALPPDVSVQTGLGRFAAEDLCQGQLGDCWLLSALSLLALHADAGKQGPHTVNSRKTKKTNLSKGPTCAALMDRVLENYKSHWVG